MALGNPNQFKSFVHQIKATYKFHRCRPHLMGHISRYKTMCYSFFKSCVDVCMVPDNSGSFLGLLVFLSIALPLVLVEILQILCSQLMQPDSVFLEIGDDDFFNGVAIPRISNRVYVCFNVRQPGQHIIRKQNPFIFLSRFLCLLRCQRQIFGGVLIAEKCV